MPKAPPKTTSTSDCRLSSDDLADLRETLDRLSQTVQVLTQAVDEVSDELQWRNNGLRDRSIPRSPPFVLHDMPKDPAARDWKINRLRADRSDSPQTAAASRSPSPPPTRGADRMLIDIDDGQCGSCGGQLEIVDADDEALHVQCLACGQTESAEPGAYGDEALSYYYGFAAGREHSPAGDSPPEQRRRDVEQLCKELADLRQIVAALVLIVSEGYGAMTVEIHEFIHGWANEEFDAEILQETFGLHSRTDSSVKSASARSEAIRKLIYPLTL